MRKKDRFTVSDGELVLLLEPAEEGGYLVTSTFEPELITEADSLEEAFAMARDTIQSPALYRVPSYTANWLSRRVGRESPCWKAI